MVLTQNVDGLHRAAGSHNLVEIHGNLHHLLCTECGRGRPVEDYQGHAVAARLPDLRRPDASERGAVRRGVARLGAAAPRACAGCGFRPGVCSVGTTSVFPTSPRRFLLGAPRGCRRWRSTRARSKGQRDRRFRIRAAAAQVLPSRCLFAAVARKLPLVSGDCGMMLAPLTSSAACSRAFLRIRPRPQRKPSASVAGRCCRRCRTARAAGPGLVAMHRGGVVALVAQILRIMRIGEMAPCARPAAAPANSDRTSTPLPSVMPWVATYLQTRLDRRAAG